MNDFYIDENATIKSILEALKVEGIKTNDIAKAIPNISEKPLRSALKLAGYEYSNKAPKGWIFVGDGEEPLNKSIFDYVKRSSPRVHVEFTPSNTGVTKGEFIKGNTNITNGETDVNSLVVHPQFTQHEVSMIMEMLYEWQQKKKSEIDVEVERNNQIHERIKMIPKGDKTRKTIVIDDVIGKRLDEYCESERVNKSDVLHIALMDFFKSYKKS